MHGLAPVGTGSFSTVTQLIPTANQHSSAPVVTSCDRLRAPVSTGFVRVRVDPRETLSCPQRHIGDKKEEKFFFARTTSADLLAMALTSISK